MLFFQFMCSSHIPVASSEELPSWKKSRWRSILLTAYCAPRRISFIVVSWCMPFTFLFRRVHDCLYFVALVFSGMGFSVPRQASFVASYGNMIGYNVDIRRFHYHTTHHNLFQMFWSHHSPQPVPSVDRPMVRCFPCCHSASPSGVFSVALTFLGHAL